MSAVLFFLAASGVITGAVGVVVLRNPFYSVLALVAHLVSLAVLFLLLRAEFVAAVQVVVYAGAVMVLYVFVVAYVGGEAGSLGERLRNPGALGSGLRLAGALVAGAMLVELLIALLGTGLEAVGGYGAGYSSSGPEAQTYGTPAYIGRLLLTRFLLAFEIASFLLLIAAVGGVVLARRRGGLGEQDDRDALTPIDLLRPQGTGTIAEGVGEARSVSIAWYLAVSAIVFSLGALGVITRRNPLVVLLCLELMLNGANLALIAFSRMWGNGDGQILALIVMTVAACEVCVGLGMIVAIYRRRLPIDVDELRELQGLMATTYGWLVLGFPLLGTLVIAFGFRALPGRSAGWIGTGAIFLSFAASVAALISLQGHTPEHRQLVSSLWNYASTVGIDAKLSILLDPLSVFMILVVTGVSTLIHLYSVSYMDGDRGFARYFAYLNFFVFSMLLLVLAGNFLLLVVGWAFVGAASYLLISFWYRRTTATRAGIKAFVINVVGDVGLVLGTYFIFKHTGTLDLLKTFHATEAGVFGHSPNEGDLVAGCVLLLVGAFAKSAQIPLHTWLPDAMEGPTPVSSLIHAATMVTAGVYLIARMHPLFERAPAAQDVGATVGAVTLLVAGTIALTQTDIKRVIAYSTMSQIGYMIMGVSVGAYAASLFHLMTHAFFKALLFMAAGSIIGAMAGEQSLERMGGFRRALPFTYACFVIGGLALSGVPPFSGFFSKDEILLVTAEHGGFWHWVLYAAGYVGAFVTATYTFRMIFRAFHGEPVPEARELEQGHLHHADTPRNPATGEVEDTDVGFPGPNHPIAERALPMKAAMALLALGAIGAGLVQIPRVDFVIDDFLQPSFATVRVYGSNGHTTLLIVGLLMGTVLGLAGIALAYRIWVVRPGTAVAVRARFRPLYELFVHKWYFDELIDAVVVRPAALAGRFARETFERRIVEDALVGGTTGVVRAGSAAVRAAQSGFVRYYAALLVLGVTGVGFYFLLQT